MTDLAQDLQLGDNDGVLAAAAGTGKKAKNEKRIKIMIDEVPGMSNYEVVGVNGRVTKIKRGAVVAVLPEVVHALENAKVTSIVQKVNKVTGEVEDHVHEFSAIPWRRV